MAIWQFGINFIPRNKISKQFKETPSHLDKGTLHKLKLDKGVRLPENFVSFLNSIAEEKAHWCNKARIWGENDGNHIDVWNWAEPEEVEVFSRLHVGDWQEKFVEGLIEFAKSCHCVLFTKNGTIIEPDFQLIVQEVKQSNSYRFCENPVAYLESDEVKKINEEWRQKLGDKQVTFFFTEPVENVDTNIVEEMKKKLSE